MEVTYAVRWTRKGARAVEYFLVPGRFAFGRCLSEPAAVLEGYWFNDSPKGVREISRKLESAQERKRVFVDDKKLQRIADCARRYPRFSSSATEGTARL